MFNLDDPKGFFRNLHPVGSAAGQVVIERHFAGARVQRSQVQPMALEWVSNQAYELEGLYFSIASFTGKPILLNFEKTTALHAQIPHVDDLTYIRATALLEDRNIPLPTATLFDGDQYTFLWFLDQPLVFGEISVYTLMQRAIYEALAPFSPDARSRDASFFTRMVGSLSPSKLSRCGIRQMSGRRHCVYRLKDKLLSPFSASEYRRIERQSGVALELLALFSDRCLTLDQQPYLYQDWIIFLGSSILGLCSQQELKSNLIAFADSLDPRPWSQCKAEYLPVIDAICQAQGTDSVRVDNVDIAINHPHWIELIRGKLEITDQEINALNLQLLSGNDEISPYLHSCIASNISVGQQHFAPIQLLLA